ncbi:MAG: hypothetical protein WBL23_07650 [Salinisphaera sp.]|uniref:hypothetical protein n=1 Tax=Salinisphaera sp. TaxID=1914330 RepID=UPI003C7BEECA
MVVEKVNSLTAIRAPFYCASDKGAGRLEKFDILGAQLKRNRADWSFSDEKHDH